MRRFRDGQEEQSGTIRRDPAGVCGRRDDQRTGEAAWSAPANGAPGSSQFDPARAKEARAGTTQTGSGERGDRPDAGQDRQAPRKQRHTAHLVWTRLREEEPDHPIGEPTVRRYVRQRKQEMGLGRREVFVPQSYDWGQEGQVDWFEAMARLDGKLCKLQLFAMRSMARNGRSIGPTATPRSKRCWRVMSTLSITSGACFARCAMTT